MAEPPLNAEPPDTGGVEDGPRSVHTFDAFRSPAYRSLWLNSLTFFLTQGTQRFTFVWLVLQLSDTSKAAGLVTFALGIPVFAFALPAGVLSDRFDRRLLLVGSNVVALVVTVLTAVLIWSDAMTTIWAFALAAGIGVTMAVGMPVRNAILPSIVRRERLLNAVVLMSIGQNVSTIAGPALGGAVIALTGIGGAFAAQAVIYAVGLVVLVPLVLPPPTPRLRGSTAIGELREGFAFIAHTRGIQVLIVLLVLTGVFMVGPSGALIPQIAKDELGSDALEASLLFAVLGVGSLLTSLLLATLGDVPNKGGLFIAALIFGSLVFAGIGLSGEYALTMFFMFAWGLCGGFFINMNQTLIQAHTPAEIMGRVMSIHTLAFMGIGPMGALWAGVMADWIGAPQWMAFCGFFLSGLAILSILTQPSLRTMR